MKNLIIVMAFAGRTQHVPSPRGGFEDLCGQSIFDRHMPLWESHGWDILVICPENSQVKTNHELIALGDSGFRGEDSKKRMDLALLQAETRDFDYVIIFEYDAFCLEPNPTMRPGFWGNVGNELNWFPELVPHYDGPGEPPHEFIAPVWTNPPWTMDKQTALKMAEAVRKYPDTYELGINDRLICGYSTRAGIPILFWGDEAFNCVPMVDGCLDALATRKVKPIWIHAVKFQEHFDRILKICGGAQTP